jgi:nucleoside-diphosphate-sugar epimerase
LAIFLCINEKKVKKILITGASGFIGSFLVEEALNHGFEVYAGIRASSSLQYLQDSRIKFLTINFANKEQLKQNLLKAGKFDYIIHNAGVTKTCKKENFDLVNLRFTQNFIEALYETNTIPHKFIQISSLAAYGPGDEKTLKPINLTDTPRPVSYYGKSKLKTERYIKSLKDFPYLIFRPTGVYGPREKDYYVMYKSIKQGIETYINTSDQHISFIYIKDLSRLIIDSLSSNISGKSYFVSDLNEYTAYEFSWLIKMKLNKKTIALTFPGFLVRMLAFINEKISCLFLGKTPTLNTEKYKEISKRNWLCDSSDLVKDFNFKPEYDLSKGLDETIKWYKKENLL